MEYSIVHLSDLHFKNDVENRFRIEKLRDDLVKLPLGANTITVFTGDLVQSGEQEQYDVLFELLLAPLIEADHHIAIVPGNCLSPVELCHYFGVTEGMIDGSEAVFG